MTATTTRPVASIGYEKATCSRCTGTGRMPFAAHGGVCYGCNGNGEKLTANGRRAKAAVDAWAAANLTVAASSLRKGDRINNQGVRRTLVADAETTLGYGRLKSTTGVAGTESYVESWQLGQTVIRTQKVDIIVAAHASVIRWWNTESLTACAAAVGHLKGAIVTYQDEEVAS